MEDPQGNSDDRPLSELSDDELLAELHARDFELRLQLERMGHGVWAFLFSQLAVVAGVALLGGSLVVAFVPSVAVSGVASTLSAFLSVLFAAGTYVAYKRANAEAERARLRSSVERQWEFLEKAVTDIEKEIQPRSVTEGKES